ncbi:TPA: putative S-layer protein [Candidatus Woesearchaeota archaeon]|nr:putative S-layer protein [Candidatus Woesearchaeota archaeon]
MSIAKHIGIFVASLVMMLAFASSALATITIESVRYDANTLTPSSTNFIFAADRGQNVPVKVQVKSDVDVDNVQVETVLRGYDHDDMVEDITDTFDMKAGVTYVKKLTLPMNLRVDQDQYKLRVRVSDRDSPTVEQTYELRVEAERHSLNIRDVVLNPDAEVMAGRALLASVRIQNTGQKDEKDIQVKVSIPDLGVSATSYLDEIEKEDDNDDAKTSEEMFLRIPADAKTGVYTVKAEVIYDDGDEKVTKEEQVRVVADSTQQKPAEPASQDKTIITLVSDVQNANAGSEASFPLTITNAGSNSKVYTIMVDGASWATFRVNPTNVLVVDAGDSKAVTVNAAVAANAAAGTQSFMVTVMADGKVLKQIPLKVNVSGAATKDGASLKKVLEVGLIVLLILIVVIGLVLGFTRNREDSGENTDDKSYY